MMVCMLGLALLGCTSTETPADQVSSQPSDTESSETASNEETEEISGEPVLPVPHKIGFVFYGKDDPWAVGHL